LGRIGRASGVLSLFASSVACGGGSDSAGVVVDTTANAGAPSLPEMRPEMAVEPDLPAAPAGVDAPTAEAPLDESTPLEEAAPPVEAPPVEAPPVEGPPLLGEEASADWPVPTLDWQPCGNVLECAEALVPRDYADPLGPKYRVAVARRTARDPAQRIGPLFFNFGGPGSGTVGGLAGVAMGRFAALNQRFDLIAIDARGTGASEALIDCRVDQEAQGLYAQPFITPQNLDVEAWTARAREYVDACVENDGGSIGVAATANVARDIELVRRALGPEPLSYLGYSYGTFLGATYASLFPNRYRGIVLDSPVDADEYINRPTQGLRAQSAGFERALGRFFSACAADPVACRGFGGADPALAFDQLVAELNQTPRPVPGSNRTLDGDDVLFATGLLLYDKGSWNTLAAALDELASGNPAPFRQLTDSAYGRNGDGSYDPAGDAYFVLTATEQLYGTEPDVFLAQGEAAFSEFSHFFSNLGYSELPYGLFPIHSTGAFRGPFVASADAPTVLVVGTTFDPATPYEGAQSLVEQLGNARLLTMNGDGHGAYGGNSRCIDTSVNAYLLDGVVPEPGTECEQEVAFGNPQAFVVGTGAAPQAVPRRILYRGRWLDL
jgi:pimeloyl-ACP methyl ester carboxylesterase